MRLAFVLLALLSLVFPELVSGIEEYSPTYDNVDVDAILKSDRLLNQYMACILETGSCTADGRYLKRILPEAMSTNCDKCNARQREIARKISKYLKEHRSELWTLFVDKYDPARQYIASFERFLAQIEV